MKTLKIINFHFLIMILCVSFVWLFVACTNNMDTNTKNDKVDLSNE